MFVDSLPSLGNRKTLPFQCSTAAKSSSSLYFFFFHDFRVLYQVSRISKTSFVYFLPSYSSSLRIQFRFLLGFCLMMLAARDYLFSFSDSAFFIWSQIHFWNELWLKFFFFLILLFFFGNIKTTKDQFFIKFPGEKIKCVLSLSATSVLPYTTSHQKTAQFGTWNKNVYFLITIWEIRSHCDVEEILIPFK